MLDVNLILLLWQLGFFFNLASVLKPSEFWLFLSAILILYLSGVSLLSWRLANCDLPQESIIGIQH